MAMIMQQQPLSYLDGRVRYAVKLLDLGAERTILRLVLENNESPLVANLVNIIRSREDGYAATVGFHLESVLLHFVAPDKQVEVIVVEEPLGHVGAKADADTALCICDVSMMNAASRQSATVEEV